MKEFRGKVCPQYYPNICDLTRTIKNQPTHPLTVRRRDIKNRYKYVFYGITDAMIDIDVRGNEM